MESSGDAYPASEPMEAWLNSGAPLLFKLAVSRIKLISFHFNHKNAMIINLIINVSPDLPV